MNTIRVVQLNKRVLHHFAHFHADLITVINKTAGLRQPEKLHMDEEPPASSSASNSKFHVLVRKVAEDFCTLSLTFCTRTE